ncbi:sensor domain-containing diguanylate cyclase [Pseudomonas aeruginosa]
MTHTKHGLRLDLRTLILVLCALTAVVMLCASYFASYRVQRQLLIDNALEANRVYATKLASITETFIGNALQQLMFSAGVQSRQLSDTTALQLETDRVLGQSMAFNSTFVIDANGVLLAVSPAPLRHLLGTHVQSPGALEALRERRPLVSTPYLSAADNLVVALSQPIFDSNGNYLGYVGGSLYLRERNILNSLLGEHFYKDGSYLYVVDRNRRLLYHPHSERVGTVVEGNALVDQLATLDSGTRQLTNSLGVVAQQPLVQTVAPLHHLVLNVIASSAPLALVGSLLLWWLARTIARPLWKLAAGARTMDRAATAEHLHQVRAWYFEAAELKRALLFSLNLLQERIGRLNRDAQTDPLTGLGNRRSLEISLSLLEAENREFAAIALDIDHFKRINDSHGHEVGDQVLRQLAELMRRCCREGDLLCRTGGEEFLILLPGATLNVAAAVAERLRVTVQDMPVEPVGAVTISLGVTHWDGETHGEPMNALGEADRALYRAKQEGRNRVAFA